VPTHWCKNLSRHTSEMTKSDRNSGSPSRYLLTNLTLPSLWLYLSQALVNLPIGFDNFLRRPEDVLCNKKIVSGAKNIISGLNNLSKRLRHLSRRGRNYLGGKEDCAKPKKRVQAMQQLAERRRHVS
jgi:hypothetical protein